MNALSESRPSLAEWILRELLVHSSVSGVRFGVLQLIFDGPFPVGEPYVNLASGWSLYPERPQAFPTCEPTHESAESELQAAIGLRHKVVSSVEVLAPHPHLVLTFSDGTVLYLNGQNPTYEPWSAGLAWTKGEERLQVIACPGGELAFVLPEGFDVANPSWEGTALSSGSHEL